MGGGGGGLRAGAGYREFVLITTAYHHTPLLNSILIYK